MIANINAAIAQLIAYSPHYKSTPDMPSLHCSPMPLPG